MSNFAPYTFELDDIVAQKILANVRNYAKHPRVAIQSIVFKIDRLVRETFAKQTDPWGTPWPVNSESTMTTRKRKSIKSKRALLATFVLFRSIDRAVDSDNEGHFTIGAPDRPVLPHLFGNPMNKAWGGPIAPIPARPMLPIREGGRVDVPTLWRTLIMQDIIANLPEGFNK